MAGWRTDDRGSLALEYAMSAPLLLLVFALIFLFARVGQVQGRLDSGTRDAARTVTQLANLADGKTRAQEIVADELGDHAGGCKNSLDVTVTAQPPNGGKDEWPPRPGDTVTVRASCTYSLANLGLPVPVDKTAWSQFSSMIDPNRSA